MPGDSSHNGADPTLIYNSSFPFKIECPVRDRDLPDNWVMGFMLNTKNSSCQMVNDFVALENTGFKPAPVKGNRSKTHANQVSNKSMGKKAGKWKADTKSKAGIKSKSKAVAKAKAAARADGHGDPPPAQYVPCNAIHAGMWDPPSFAATFRRTFLSRDARDTRTRNFLRVLSRRMRSAEETLRRQDPAAARRAHSIAKKSLQRLCGAVRDVEDVDKDVIDEKILRFAYIATMVAFGGGQSELLHLDWGDQHTTYTVISVFSTEGWKSDKRQGWLVLPTLNVEVEMKPGSWSLPRVRMEHVAGGPGDPLLVEEDGEVHELRAAVRADDAGLPLTSSMSLADGQVP